MAVQARDERRSAGRRTHVDRRCVFPTLIHFTSTLAAWPGPPSLPPTEIHLRVSISTSRCTRDPALRRGRVLFHTGTDQEAHADVVLSRRDTGLRRLQAQRKPASRVFLHALTRAIAEAQIVRGGCFAGSSGR